MVYYRNKTEVISYEGFFVDAGSLWMRKGDLMVLVDDDQYVSTAYSEKMFNLEKKYKS